MIWIQRIKPFAIAIAVIAAGALLTAARDEPSRIETVRQQGELVVAMRQGPASFYTNSFGPAGFDYELASGFARELGVQLKVVPVESARQGRDLLAAGEVDMAVGQAQHVADPAIAHSIPVQSVTQFVVCDTSAGPVPANARALGKRPLLVAAGSPHADQLEALRRDFNATFTWREVAGASEENLLGAVHEDRAGCAVIDSNEWDFHRHLYPDLRVAFELPRPAFTGWALTAKGDPSLRELANAYLARRLADGTVAALRDRYYAHVQSLTGIDGKRFYKAIRHRLPRYADLFRREAERNNLDWRLLAAVAYQESLWDPAAQSPTGVQGIMQLTLETSLQLGIDDRTDPVASIKGGARYLRQIIDALPKDIPEADRTWMALAAYNAGLSHVLDARELTRKRGGNPDSWPEVRDNLALLKQQRWYSQTRYGYARGATQAIIYVRHVRRYYDLLVLASNSTRNDQMMLAMGGPAHSSAN